MKNQSIPYGISQFNKISCKNKNRSFDLLKSFTSGDLDASTVVDANCSSSDLYVYLDQNKSLPKKFIGLHSSYYTALEIMQKIGKEVYAKDVLFDQIPVADYYYAIDATQKMSQSDIYTFISKCYSKSQKAFIFNVSKFGNVGQVYRRKYDYNLILYQCKILTWRTMVYDIPGSGESLIVMPK